ncbi:unnamed protein product [Rotaria sp. Silwood1]|nr:unnamed protein product [Rotaria sp. Silwood1]CAF3591723.1 unnamed protein product [Rotaria sp. Silwood1]CAF3647868.1 unnamed protein product [Rotaria sp. Silwood1]CAF4681881.1 unnamed protein product [Rotaria sp. Silwood1]CAF4696372.1 unnamed protein product [Rotaria sp. Silwood1]
MKETTIISAVDIDDNDEELIHTKTFFRRHSKGPVMFNGCSPSGDVIIIDNISTKKKYDLTGWYIERQTDTHQVLQYRFTDQFIIPPLTTIELWSSAATPIPIPPETQEQQQHQQQQSFVCIKTKLLTWNNARRWSITRLYDKTGHEKAVFSHQTLPSMDKEKQE